MSIKSVIKAWPMGRYGRKVAVETYVVDSSKPDYAARSLKDQVDAYVAGMDRAAAKSRLGVEAGGDLVEGIPDSGVERLAEGDLFFLRGEFTFADRNGKEFAFNVSADPVKCCFGCLGHAVEPTDAVAEPG